MPAPRAAADRGAGEVTFSRTMRLASRLGLSALSAALMVLSVPTFDWWPLMWVALIPALHVSLTATTPRRAFLQGWFTGVLANTVAFFWMKGLLERFGHMPAIQAIPIMMLLTTYQGLEFGLWSWGVHRLHRQRPDLSLAWVAPLVMVVIELVVPQIFPFYLAISQAWVPAVIQMADLTGPMGVSFVMVMVTGALYQAGRALTATATATTATTATTAISPRHLAGLAGRRLAVPAAVLACVLLYGGLRIHQVDARRAAAPKAKVGIVQANVGINEKWDPRESARLLALHQQQSADLALRGADLVVWPESSYPYALPRDLAADLPLGDTRRVRRDFQTPLLFGAVTLAPEPRTGKARFPYNTALMMDGAGRITGTFDKVFLLIFGEYIPFYEHIPWFTDVFPDASNFNRGDRPAVFPLRVGANDFRVGPLICYEDILPGFSRQVAALEPNLFVNITNDAWFGKTAEPYQHLALAVFRSVEHRLEMVRAVNTGVSAHIDAVGRVRASGPAVDPDTVPPPEPVALLAEVSLLERGGLYGHVGDLFAYLCLGLVTWLVGIPRGLRRRWGKGRVPGRQRASKPAVSRHSDFD
ncbi:MAG: apolipoprotein N-acyltransferase [Polyangia bacterium]